MSEFATIDPLARQIEGYIERPYWGPLLEYSCDTQDEPKFDEDTIGLIQGLTGQNGIQETIIDENVSAVSLRIDGYLGDQSMIKTIRRFAGMLFARLCWQDETWRLENALLLATEQADSHQIKFLDLMPYLLSE